MRKINKLKTKIVLILSAMLSSSILLSSCSSVITNDNSNVEKPVPSIDLKILNNKVNENEIIENDFDLFLKNLGNHLTNTKKQWYEINEKKGWIYNNEILIELCSILNSNFIKFNKDVKYNFYLVDGKENPDFNSEFNSYKIILKIDAIEEVKSINFFGKDLVSLNNNKFLFFENVNKTRDYDNVVVEDRFTIDEVDGMTGADKYLIIGGTTSNFHSFFNSFDLLVKHFYNLGIYNIHSLRFSSGIWTINQSNKDNENNYNIDRNVYDYIYYHIHVKKLAELVSLLETKHENKSFDLIKIEIDKEDRYAIAFKTFPY